MKRQPLQDTTFFMLTPDVRDRLLEIKLTAAEWRVWCYLVSLDPFGDRGAKFSPAKLMLKCSIKKTTYFATKAKFQKLGLFDFRDGVTKVVNLQTSLEKSDNSDYSQQAEIIESEISESEISDSEILEFGNSESHSEISESQFGNSDNRSLKPIPSKASKTPQTIQTYTDFIQTLSESERENFLKFVEKKIHNLEKPINDLEAWLASQTKAKQNRWEVYYQSYQQEEGQKITRQNLSSDSTALEEKKLAVKNWQEHLKRQEKIYKEQEERTEEKDLEPKSQSEQELKTTTNLSTGIPDPWSEVQLSDNRDIKSPDGDIDGYINSADNELDSAHSDRHPINGDVNSADNSDETSPSQESESERTTQAVEGASTDVSSLKQKIDQILNGFSRVEQDNPNIPPGKPEQNLSQKMNEALQYLRGMEVTKYKSETDERDLGGEAK